MRLRDAVRGCPAWTVETKGDIAVDLPLWVSDPEERDIEVWAGLASREDGGDVLEDGGWWMVDGGWWMFRVQEEGTWRS